MLFLLFLILIAGAMLSASSTARAATVRVMNCSDSGPGSLRNAVTGAVSGDTIDLTALPCRKIVLTSGAIHAT